jgi:hypothetical protein
MGGFLIDETAMPWSRRPTDERCRAYADPRDEADCASHVAPAARNHSRGAHPFCSRALCRRLAAFFELRPPQLKERRASWLSDTVRSRKLAQWGLGGPLHRPSIRFTAPLPIRSIGRKHRLFGRRVALPRAPHNHANPIVPELTGSPCKLTASLPPCLCFSIVLQRRGL